MPVSDYIKRTLLDTLVSNINETLKEVYIQFKGTDSTFIPVARHTIAPVLKTSANEMRVQVLIEVK
jgi:hypothetical protein